MPIATTATTSLHYSGTDMEIATKKSAQFKNELIDAISNEPDVTRSFEELAAKWAKQLIKETFEGAVNCRKYFTEELVFSVTIALGGPDDEDTD